MHGGAYGGYSDGTRVGPRPMPVITGPAFRRQLRWRGRLQPGRTPRATAAPGQDGDAIVSAMKANEINIQNEFERLQEALDAFEALRTGDPEALVRRSEEVSGWSVAQHLYHIALATDLAFRHVKSLVAGKGRLIQEEGEIGQRAGEVLLSDTTPRGEAKAPRMVTPDDEVNPEYLEMEQRSNQDALKGLRLSLIHISEPRD